LHLFDALSAAVAHLAAAAAAATGGQGQVQQQQLSELVALQQELQQLAPETALAASTPPHADASGREPTAAAVGQPDRVFLSKQAAKGWGQQLLQLLERWAQQSHDEQQAAAANSMLVAALQPRSTSVGNIAAAVGGASSAANGTLSEAAAAAAGTAVAATAVQLALQQLGAPSAAGMAADEATWAAQHTDSPEACYSYAYQKRHLVDLILSLRSAGELPCIVFSFERGLCMALAEVLTEQLQAAEDAWRSANAGRLDAARKALWEASLAGNLEGEGADEAGGRSASRKALRKAAAAAESSSDGDMRVLTVGLGGVVASVDEDLPDPSFTLLTNDKTRSQVGCGKGFKVYA
jgi:hypothetical protein